MLYNGFHIYSVKRYLTPRPNLAPESRIVWALNGALSIHEPIRYVQHQSVVFCFGIAVLSCTLNIQIVSCK